MKNLHSDRRSKYSLQVIRSALFELLEEKSLEKITVTDICNQADINRGTFYKYYKDVPDLFSKIESSIIDEACQIIEKDCINSFSIKKVISNILSVINDNKDFNYLLVKNPTELHCLREIVQRFYPQFIEVMLKNIPQLTEKNINICFEFILGGTINLIIQWSSKNIDISQKEMEDVLIRFIYSIFNENNFKELN